MSRRFWPGAWLGARTRRILGGLWPWEEDPQQELVLADMSQELFLLGTFSWQEF
jgi:hypothetical protein